MQGGIRANAGRTTVPLEMKKKGHKIYIDDKMRNEIMEYAIGNSFSEKCYNLIENQIQIIARDKNTINFHKIIKSKNQNKAIHSPFRYAGGKYYARKLIVEHIPPHTSYYEPFAGGASIFFAKEKVNFNALNDIDEKLMLVYRIIRDFPNDLIEFLSPYPATKYLHSYFKNEFIPRDELEIAGRWYYLNRTSYSGIMNMPNCYWGYGDKYSMQPKNWPKAIYSASKKLQGVELLNQDFEEIINNAEDGALLFVDPPYFNADQDKFYPNSFTRECHLRLCEALRNNSDRLNLFITYDNCDDIREMYSWALNMYDKEWNYCISRTDDQKNGTDAKGTRKKGKELFILNY